MLSPLNTQAVIVIDMNGNVVKQWDGFVNSAGGPARVFPGGFVMAANGTNPPRQESLELVARDFDGKVLWRFDRNEQIQTRDGKTIWSARQHHDWQREDYPAGYYSPEAQPVDPGRQHARPDARQPQQAGRSPTSTLEDDRLIEVVADGRDPVAVGRERPRGGVRASPRRPGRPSRPPSPPIRGGPAARAGGPTPSGEASTGCTSTRRPTSGRTAGSTRAIGGSRRTTSSSAAGRPASWRSSAATARSCGGSGPDFLESKELQRHPPDHRPASPAHHPEGAARRGQPDGVRQRRFERLRRADGGVARRLRHLPARRLARARNQPEDARAGLVLHRARGSSARTSAARSGLPNGNTLITEGAPGRLLEVTDRPPDRVGIHLSGVRRRRSDERRLPGLPGAVRLDSADREAHRAAGHPASAHRLQGAVERWIGRSNAGSMGAIVSERV